MSLSKTAFLSLFVLTILPLSFVAIAAETKTQLEFVDTNAMQAELDQLKSKISKLELKIAEKIKEWEKKDQEEILPEKSDSISSMQNEVDYVQRWSQISREQLSAFTSYLAPHIQSLFGTIYEAYYSLRVSSVHHIASIPDRLPVQINHLKSFAWTHWNERGRPTITLAVHRVLEKGTQVQKWAEPYIETITIEWIPLMKNYLLDLIPYLEHHVQSLSSTTTDLYNSFKSSTLLHHVFTMQDIINPYFQQAKRKAKPYINQFVVATTPIFDESCAVLRPYTRNVVEACRKAIKFATVYFFEVKETFESNEVTKHLVAMSPSWSMTTASLALPAIYLVILFLIILSGKTKKQSRASNTKSKGRRSKRRYHDM